jgi:hypothetical protein
MSKALNDIIKMTEIWNNVLHFVKGSTKCVKIAVYFWNTFTVKCI